MNLPYSNILPIDRLSRCFDSTTNAYKFYWFLTILEMLSSKKSKIKSNSPILLPTSIIAKRMFAKVWYPIDFHKLSFGKLDGFVKIYQTLQEKGITIDGRPKASKPLTQLNTHIKNNREKFSNNEFKSLLKDVPHRFIRPFFKEKVKKQENEVLRNSIWELANEEFANQTHFSPYRYKENIDSIEVDKQWAVYFIEHYKILQHFTYWNLVKFLQKRNPNVIAISKKLFKPKSRDETSFNQRRDMWKDYIVKHVTYCIYSGKKINTQSNLSIDHFLPWSYVAHEEVWNLIPTTININSSKNNDFPKLDFYLSSFINLQYDFYRFVHQSKSNIVEDYNKLFKKDDSEIKRLNKKEFGQLIQNIIKPLYQIGIIMGYKSWTYQP